MERLRRRRKRKREDSAPQRERRWRQGMDGQAEYVGSSREDRADPIKKQRAESFNANNAESKRASGLPPTGPTGGGFERNRPPPFQHNNERWSYRKYDNPSETPRGK